MKDLYLRLQKLVEALEEGGAHGLAEDVRDAMDNIWYKLTPAEVAELDGE